MYNLSNVAFLRHRLSLTPWPARRRPLGALLALALLVPATATAERAEPLRMSAQAFGTDVEIEVRDLPRSQAEPAIREALEEVLQISQLTDGSQAVPGGIGFLNAAAGAGPQVVDPRIADLVISSSRYCLWSANAHGPLGGGLYELWNAPSGALPHPVELRQATGGAACGRLRHGESDGERTIELAENSRLFLRGFERGYATDRAVEILRRHGAANFWVEMGTVYRAVGGGADGEGWLVSIPAQPDNDDVLERMKLRDQALAVVSVYAIGDEAPVRWIDQRTGTPARGVLTLMTVAANAFDAEMVATSLFIIGLRDGQRRLGSLEPRPSILWLLGDNKGGEPLVSTYRWSEVHHLKRTGYR